MDGDRYECDCGAIYRSIDAINACASNNHGQLVVSGRGAGKSTRASSPSVRNPILSLPAAQMMAQLPATDRAAMRGLLKALSKDCRDRANKAWRTHKPPMAAYWKAMSVYARHISLVLR